MFTIEEVNAARPAPQYNIPAGAKREYEVNAVKRAVEEQARREEIGVGNTVRKAVLAAWQKLTSAPLPETRSKQTAG